MARNCEIECWLLSSALDGVASVYGHGWFPGRFPCAGDHCGDRGAGFAEAALEHRAAAPEERPVIGIVVDLTPPDRQTVGLEDSGNQLRPLKERVESEAQWSAD